MTEICEKMFMQREQGKGKNKETHEYSQGLFALLILQGKREKAFGLFVCFLVLPCLVLFAICST